MRITIAQCCSKGGRSNNEDSCLVVNRDDCYLCAVADGLGGHGGGDVASKEVTNYVSNMIENSLDCTEHNMQIIFEEINKKVLEKQTAICKMKSTGVLLIIKGQQAIWGHVGDSRLYHFINGRLIYQTMDHSVSQMAVLSGEITTENIRFHEDRNRVLRAFGAGREIKPTISEAMSISQDFHVFLLCTDGFWEYILEGEMEIDLAKAETPEEWLGFMNGRIGKRVPYNHDNLTAVAIFLTNSKIRQYKNTRKV